MSITKTEPTAPIETLPQQFQRLVAQWRKETMVLSDAGKIMRHLAFQAIVALGDDALPLILHELESRPSLLVWTLPKITGENPVPPGNDGKIDQLTAAWLKWGRAKGLV